ncbi:MAG: GAF domain-containing protein [Planctomycetes bacterium]|nr:GAF domain-containing protein [Planctomycetota bacterium]
MPSDALQRRDRVLDAVVRACDILSAQAPWRELVAPALAVLGDGTGVSRVYVFDVAADAAHRLLASQRFEWCAAGVAPQLHHPELQGLDLVAAGYERWVNAMTAGAPVVGDIEDFPASERPLLAEQGILSLLAQPVHVAGRWWGFIGFDACARRQRWAKFEVDVLRIAARVLGATIHQQEREAALRRTQKMEALGRMAGGIAHDFQNVLMILGAELDGLGDDLAGGAALTTDRRGAIDLMRQALLQASGLTRRLLDFSRRREGAPELLAVDAALARAEPLLRQAAGSAVVLTLAVAATPAPWPIRIDPVQFEQVLMNLVVNARDAMPHGGRLRLGVAGVQADDAQAAADGVGPGDWTLLHVVDDGVGMSKEVQERIFDPFFSTKPPDQGTGLGLANVYSIVHAAGGHVAVTSAPGEGAAFRLYFPAAR